MNSNVSIIIPTFNRADLIKETIDSVFTQTYKNFELIIADDGSSDNTKEVVGSLNDSRIVYIKLSHSGLPAYSRNRAIEISKGKFIAFLDSDDLWLPKKLETCLTCFDSKPSVGLVCSNEFLINKDSIPMNETVQVRIGKDSFIDFNKLFLKNMVSSSTAVVRRECIEKVGKFNESKNFRAVEDFHLWLRIAAEFPIYYIDEPLGYYRIHDGSVRLNTEKSLINLYNTLIDIYKQFPDLIKNNKKAAVKHIRLAKKAILLYFLKQMNFHQFVRWIFK